jgi:hypothetical protein
MGLNTHNKNAPASIGVMLKFGGDSNELSFDNSRAINLDLDTAIWL